MGLAAALGVGIDLDHFLLARLNAGDWRTLRRGIADPRLVVLDQSDLVREGEVLPFQRLASHLAIGGPLVAALGLASPYLAWLGAVTLWAHLLADAAWEHARRERVAEGTRSPPEG